jgi:hypothetical protein
VVPEHPHATGKVYWLVVGDFILIRKPEDINKEGAISLKCFFLMGL